MRLKRARDSERLGQRALVLTLAEALYERERGAPPPTIDALVGPYLKGLPPDNSGEVDSDTPNIDD